MKGKDIFEQIKKDLENQVRMDDMMYNDEPENPFGSGINSRYGFINEFLTI